MTKTFNNKPLTIIRIEFTEMARKEIEKNKSILMNNSFIIFPMVCKPVPISKNRLKNYGFITINAPRTSFLKTANRSQINAIKSAKCDEVIAAINYVMESAFSINKPVFAA